MKNIMKKVMLLLLLLSSFVFSQAKFSELNSMPGAFSRMGFGARGMSMGNALSAVTTGEMASYYNPALSIFQEGNSFNTSFSLLSLDRKLSFINFTKRFGEPVGSPDDKFTPSAGICAGLISSGVSNIDERDDEGNILGSINTTENQFFFAVSNHFSRRLALGIAFKLYYYRLYEQLSTTSLGIDVGLLYIINSDFTLSFVMTDLLSKYRWDSGLVFSSGGQQTEDKFPLMKKIGLAHKFFDSKLTTAVEFETSNGGANIFRFGTEYNLIENLFVRFGMDRIVLNNSDIPVRPTFGFTYNYKLESYFVGVNYAYVVEPYSPWNAHVIGININF